MKKISVLCLLLSLILILQRGMPALAVDDGDTQPERVDVSVTGGSHTLRGTKPLGGNVDILDTAKAALVYEMSTGTLLYAWNADAKAYPGSLAKLMTALLAVERGNLEDVVTVSETAVNSLEWDAKTIRMKAGEIFTVKDLIYCVMVASSNEACNVLAEYIGGDKVTFVEMMNARAQELGCTGTHFTNAHGLHDENQYTTARDIALIVEKGMEYELYAESFAEDLYIIPENPNGEERVLYTTNYMISKDVVQKFYNPRVIGGKSGAVSIDDRSLIVTARENGLKLMAVVMGAEGEYEPDGFSMHWFGNFEEMEDLLDYAFAAFETTQILQSGKSVAQFSVFGGENDVVGCPVSSAKSSLPLGTTMNDLDWKYVLDSDLKAPVTEGTIIGTVQVWYGNVCVAQSEMVAMNGSRVKTAAGKPDPVAPDPVAGDDGGGTVLKVMGIVFAGLLLVALVYFGLLWLRAARVKARHRRRRKDRRRNR